MEQHVRAVRQLASLLRSGRSLAEAWLLLERAWRDGPAGPVAADIAAACRAALAAHGMGLPTSTGLERHVRGSSGASAAAWERVVWSLRLAEGVGAAPAELLDRVADQLEATEDRRRSLEAVMAGPRATQRLLSWLPLFGLGLAQLMGAEPLIVLTTHPLGVSCLGAGLALWWLNRVWAGRLVRAAERDGP
ncbi:type II secretion system F family protein [Arthrobacter ginkgonis]|uniref:type II secretion system F family protein n=1 Tax=Arthrobacter ginkgonis TaxID=1630594 RepID=UPI0031E55DD5